MKALLLLLLLALTPGIANAAGLYKCSKDGHPSYQDFPCDQTSSQTQLQVGRSSSMIGCYVAEFPAWESAGKGTSAYFEILAATNSEYELQFQDGKNQQRLPMSRATPEVLRELSREFHAHLVDGITMKWQQGTPNQKPIGVYTGYADGGKNVILAFFFLSNGLATKVACR